MVIGGSFAFFKADRACGAGGQAVAQAVAVILAQQPRLAIYHADGPLMAGGGTQAAAVAFFFVNVDDPSFHVIFLPVHLPAGARGCTRTAFAAVSIPRPQETVCCFYNEIHIFADTDKKRSVHRAQQKRPMLFRACGEKTRAARFSLRRSCWLYGAPRG